MDPAVGQINLCRLCGKDFHGKGSLAAKYRTFIQNVFNVDVCQDDPAIYPKVICSSCHSRISRHRKMASKPELRKGIKEKFPTLYQFTHSSPGGDSSAVTSLSDEPSTADVEVMSPDDSPSTSLSSKAMSIPDVYGSSISIMDTGGDLSAVASFSDAPSTAHVEVTSPVAGPSSQPMSVADSEISPIPGVSGLSMPVVDTGAEYFVSGGDEDEEPIDAASTPKISKGVRGLKRKLVVESSVPDNTTMRSAITSVLLDLFLEQKLAELFVCSICQGVPTKPCVLRCTHIFCKPCVEARLSLKSACPTCREACEECDMEGLTGLQLLFFESLTLHCPNSQNGCTVNLKVTSLPEHLSICHYTKGRRGKGYSKTPLAEKKLSYIRHQRLPKVIEEANDVIDKFCTDTYEDKTDVHFALLINYLENKQDHERATQVWKVWKGETLQTMTLTPDQCLAIRVDNLQSKAQYKKQFDFLHTQLQDQNPFQTPSSVTKSEQKYMPARVQYALEGQQHDDSFYHTPAKPPPPGKIHTTSTEPIDIMEDFPPSTPEFVSPNVAGVRWCYMDAIAKTLAELNSDIDSNLEKCGRDKSKRDMLFKTYIKDGAKALAMCQSTDRPVIVLCPTKHLGHHSVYLRLI